MSEADLNIRSGPGTNYQVIDVVGSGTVVDVRGCSGGWCRVSYGGSAGWASRSYLAFAGGGGGYASQPVVAYGSGYPDYAYSDYYPDYGYWDYGYPYYGSGFGLGFVFDGSRFRHRDRFFDRNRFGDGRRDFVRRDFMRRDFARRDSMRPNFGRRDGGGRMIAVPGRQGFPMQARGGFGGRSFGMGPGGGAPIVAMGGGRGFGGRSFGMGRGGAPSVGM
ncbi:MAG: SH3 domain-containing protein, partial [Variibacter sp.]|nr:SH3 domain-containing protein [Variibacter sp.]